MNSVLVQLAPFTVVKLTSPSSKPSSYITIPPSLCSTLLLPFNPLKLNHFPVNSQNPPLQRKFLFLASASSDKSNNGPSSSSSKEDGSKKGGIEENGLKNNGDGIGGNSGGGNGNGNGRPRLNLKWVDMLLDPDPDNVVAVGLTGVLAWASVQVLWQLFVISIAILLAALKYSFVAALLIFILITLL